MPPTHFGTWLRRYQEALAATTAAAQLPTLPSAPLPVDPIPPQRTRAEAWLN